MNFQVYDLLYSQFPDQHVSAALASIFKVSLLLQEHKDTNVFSCTHYRHTKHMLPHNHDGLIILFKYFNSF